MAMSKALEKAQKNYRERNRNKGMSRVNVWVPEENADELRAIAYEMRIEKKQKMGEAV